ncbi:MAG: relaxase domain-containing protein [Akkermansiaceae bacterium]|nr:relaxase domain-containing protein [Akkermansiaceae bacterium]
MLTLKHHFPSAATSTLFENHLPTAASDGCRWFGIGIKTLSLKNRVTVEALRTLLANRHPIGNELLATYPEAAIEKPLPLLTEVMMTMPRKLSKLVATDERIFAAHCRASSAAMRDLELFAATPVWDGRFPLCEVTFNVVAAAFDYSFIHLGTEILQSRYLLFNLTFHENEEEWRFLDTAEMVDVSWRVNENYLSYLAAELRGLGHEVTEKILYAFESSDRSLIKRLS